MLGFCTPELYPFGPVHTYVPELAGEVRLMLLPTQMGELEPAVGVAGVGFITALYVATADVHPLAMYTAV